LWFASARRAERSLHITRATAIRTLLAEKFREVDTSDNGGIVWAKGLNWIKATLDKVNRIAD
jgi:hypothetical protein